MTLCISLEEAASGCHKVLDLTTESPCAECNGSGKIELQHSVACSACKGVGRSGRGRHNVHCVSCNGRGYVRRADCSACDGHGTISRGRQIEVRIPPGMQPGERLRLARQHRRVKDEAAGDLFVTLMFHPHPLFTLEGRNLSCRMPVNIYRLMHGGTIHIPTLDGLRPWELPPYPGHGLDYTLPGLGFPGRHGRGAGSLQLTLVPVLPRQVSTADQALLLRLERSLLNDTAATAPELAAWEATLRQWRQNP